MGKYDIVFVLLLLNINHTLCYNVDINNTVIFQGGGNDTQFGYTSAFVIDSNSITLIIGSPNDSSSSANTGAIYFCDVNDQNSCRKSYSSPYNLIQDPVTKTYSTTNEGFGTSIIPFSSSTIMVCAPGWKDLQITDRVFVIGRCILVNMTSDTPGIKTSPSVASGDLIQDRYFKYAMLQVGFSAAKITDISFVMGTPGMNEWTGGFLVNKLNRINNFLEIPNTGFPTLSSQPREQNHMLLGYAVASGKFCDGERVCFVAGAPRYDNSGKVYVYEQLGSTFDKQIVALDGLTAPDDMFGSYFGSVVAAADLNGDGWDDILVGAPTYTDASKYRKEDIFSNEGRVLVFYSLGNAQILKINFNRNSAILSGTNTPFSRFGSSISNLGDINADSFDDIAVGAPNEDDDRGVVYIYHGGNGGINKDFTQRITAQTIRDDLRGFGSHISRPMDVNDDSYPDLSVGSVYSGNVVVLKTRPIVDIRVSLEFEEERINLIPRNCPSVTGIESCIRFKVCFTHGGRNVPMTIDVSYNVSVDVKAIRERARLEKPIREPVNLIKAATSCTQHTIVTYETPRIADPFSAVQVKLEYKMIEPTTKPGDIQPIANQSRTNSIVKDIYFQLQCGTDNLCEVDLKLSSDISRAPIAEYIIVNKTDHVLLNTSVRNLEEESFGSKVLITWNDEFVYRRVISPDDQPVTCDIQTERLNSTEPNLICRIIEPLKQGQEAKFSVVLETDMLSLTKPNMHFNLSTDSSSEDINSKNNQEQISSKIWIIAHPEITGSASPAEVTVVMEEDLACQNLSITHRYQVINKGPSFLPPTNITIDLPYYYESGEELVKSVSAKVNYGNENDMFLSCFVVSGFSPGGQGMGTTITSITDETTTTTTTTKQYTTKPITTNTNDKSTTTPRSTLIPSRPPRKRRRKREATMEEVDGSNSVRIHSMTCSDYRCRQLVCMLNKAIQPSESVVVNITVDLVASDLPLEDSDVLRYVSVVNIQQPKHNLFYTWNQQQIAMLSTRIFKEYTLGDSVNIWIPIGCCIAALILLVLIVIILKKCGFFKRKKKAALQKWKRESGYYHRQSSEKSRSSSTKSKK
ncbi:hypothetical protein LOTGIDRAFT_238706 [Lottia gigantea]|uniref:Uncharacterized protein n=1 Tax=Lottia gigantea TaxID=225164 RepID=V4B0Q7_LOTGI|nr:hypothetical protein LOTGIDRAFT_238706 [Lottia gigantea]ESO99806.1 hypothetical protein LOTGIDRAFT_238706 [Lottia gigantea]